MSLSFLAQMGWKSALISGVALALLFLLRSRSAADRAAVLRLCVALLLALPLISALLPALQIEAPQASALGSSDALPPMPFVAEPAPLAPEPALPLAAVPAPAPSLLDDPETLAAILYVGGLLVLALRLLVGLAALRRWTERAEAVTHPAWLAALERSAGGRDVRLLLSREVPAPMSWGMRRPVILLDADTTARAQDAEAVIAHEMAHVVRADWTALMLSRIAVALFWFNPLVWLVERQAIRQAEEAADCAAVDRVEPAHYAQTLVSCARRSCGHAVPANSIAPSGKDLAVRVRAILDGSHRARRSGSRWTMAAMGSCVLFAVPLAATELVPAHAEILPPPPSAPPAPAMPAPAAPPRLAVAAAPPAAPQLPQVAPLPPEAPAAAVPALPPAPAAAPPAPLPEVRIAIADGPRILVAPSAVAIAVAPAAPRVSAGPQPPRPPRPRAVAVSADDLVAMRIHGITPEHAREMAAAVRARLSADDLVAMRIHGVTARFARDVAAAGYRPSADDLVAMRIHGVTAEQARRARRSGASIDDLVAQAVLGEID